MSTIVKYSTEPLVATGRYCSRLSLMFLRISCVVRKYVCIYACMYVCIYCGCANCQFLIYIHFTDMNTCFKIRYFQFSVKEVCKKCMYVGVPQRR